MKARPFLKSERLWLGLMLIALAAVAVAVWVVLALRVLEPSPLTWDTISPPIVTPTTLTISAETVRHDEGCTNGPQIDIRSREELTRLPVPTRIIKGRLSTYQTVLVQPLDPGFYSIRLREIVTCGADRHDIPSPWIAFRVPTISPTR